MIEIYIPLLEEGTPTYRPTQGVAQGNQAFLVLPTPDYDPDDEIWEYKPGSLVVCSREVKGGEEILIARQLLASPTDG